MSPLWLLICINPLLGKTFAHVNSYQLPDGDTVKSLNVTINREVPELVIHVYCHSYDSLKDLTIPEPTTYPSRGVEITFVDCFNNRTDNENYQSYRLWDTFSRALSISEHDVWYQIDVYFGQYAKVNSDVFFENFNFSKFQDSNFHNFDFETSRYLRNYTCRLCLLNNIKHLNFDDLNIYSRMQYFIVTNSEIINLNSENLKKIGSIRSFELDQFSLDDHKAFNVPNLFEHNGKLNKISIENSKHKITLNEDVFKGLHALRYLVLENLQLDELPENIFVDLPKVSIVILRSNNIKTLHPNTFAHFNGLKIDLSDNPIFTMPHDKIEGLAFNTDSLYMGAFTPATLNIVEGLINTPKLRLVKFQKLLADPIDITEFTKIHTNREQPIKFNFEGLNVGLDMQHIKLHSIVQKSITYQPNYKKDDEANVIVRLPINPSLCDDCWMIKQLFADSVDDGRFYPDFHFEQSRVLIKPHVACTLRESNLETVFETNCPTGCVCRRNGLLDKIIIDCWNRNLTEIPVIPYPDQYPNISTIELNFNDNFVTNLTFDNQNPRVLEKLSTIRFRNNGLVAISLPDGVVNGLYVFDVCENDGLLDASIEIRTAAGVLRYSRRGCSIGSRYPTHPISYIKSHKTGAEIEAYLDSLCSTSLF